MNPTTRKQSTLDCQPENFIKYVYVTGDPPCNQELTGEKEILASPPMAACPQTIKQKSKPVNDRPILAVSAQS